MRGAIWYEWPKPSSTRSPAQAISLSVLSPLILSADLLLLIGGEIVGDVEGFADLLRRLALDHVSDGLATNIEKRLDIKVVGGLVAILLANYPLCTI